MLLRTGQITNSTGTWLLSEHVLCKIWLSMSSDKDWTKQNYLGIILIRYWYENRSVPWGSNLHSYIPNLYLSRCWLYKQTETCRCCHVVVSSVIPERKIPFSRHLHVRGRITEIIKEHAASEYIRIVFFTSC